MPFNRARYVTICQQFLVTATVGAVGLSAAGVMTLRIVAPEDGTAGAATSEPFRSAVHRQDQTYVDTDPVAPKVREVAVAGVDATAAREIPGLVTAAPAAPPRTAPPSTSADREPAARPQQQPVVVLSRPQPVHGYATVGVTWSPKVHLSESDIAVQVRTREDGHWSQWQALEYHDEHAPEASEEGGHVRPGTDALVIGEVDEVQMKAETRSGSAPADMKLAVIDPGTGTTRKEAPAIDTAKIPTAEKDARTAPVEETTGDTAGASASGIELQAMKPAPRPTIYSRAQWGADESIREPGLPEYGTIKTGFIHHTVNANDYSAAEVPSLIRGIYAYHVKSRGWRDIGYNFLVDRFGRIWEGRYGGVTRPVVGAHTLGYNEVSFAMSAIGNFDITRPPEAVVDAYARLFAWKLSLYRITADRTHIWVKDRYLNAINGHRDVGATACPGRYLYARIPDVRVKARQIQNAAQVTTTTPPDDPTRPIARVPAEMPSPLTTPRAASTLPALSRPARISVAGSGWPDLVTKASNGDIRVTALGGMAGFGPRVESPGPWAGLEPVAAIGNVVGDKENDVLARNPRTGLSGVYAGIGGGRIAAKPSSTTYAFRYSNLLLGVGDWNRDGHDDVVSRDRRTKGLYLHLGTGNGQFSRGHLIWRQWLYLHTAAAGDFNRDGHVDLIVFRTGDNRLIFWPGRGGSSVTTALGRPTALGNTPELSAMGGGSDMTGDADTDLMVRLAGSGDLKILVGNGRGRFRTQFGPFDGHGLDSVTTAPIRSNRRGDIVGVNRSTGRLVVIGSNGRRNIERTLPGNLNRTAAEEVLTVGDWDGDGKVDIMTREFDGKRLTLWPGNGDGTFGRGRSLGDDWATVTDLAAVGDVTGDKRPDLVGAIKGGRMIIWPGNGFNGIKAPVYAPQTMRTYNQVGSGSWVTGTEGARYRVSDGRFVPAAGKATTAAGAARSMAGYDQVVGVGDANGDGVADVIARGSTTGGLWLLPGKTSGGTGHRMWVGSGFGKYQSIG